MEEIFVTCASGLEPLLQHELSLLGISPVRPGFLGVYVPQTINNVYRINYCSRLATRVLWPLASFPCPDQQTLYREAKKIPWHRIIDPLKTFAIDANVTSHPTLRHSLFAAQVMKDALCDQIRDKMGSRPSVDIALPDVQLNLFIYKGRAIISLDTSGAPLFKRGWRLRATEAPLQETLAAALLFKVNYDPDRDILCDPFCGSGTILIEAALIATRTPPGFLRKKWGFVHLPQHLPSTWNAFKTACDAQRRPLTPNTLLGCDKNYDCITLVRDQLAPLNLEIPLIHTDITTYKPSPSPTLIVTNPPFGKRLETSETLLPTLKTFSCDTYALLPEDQGPTRPTLSFRTGGLPVGLYKLAD